MTGQRERQRRQAQSVISGSKLHPGARTYNVAPSPLSIGVRIGIMRMIRECLRGR